MTSKRLTPYQRIVRNAKKGRGVVLSAQEVSALALDDAIVTCAYWDDDPEDAEQAASDEHKARFPNLSERQEPTP